MKITALTTGRPEDASYQYRIKAPLVEVAHQNLAQVSITDVPANAEGADVVINHHNIERGAVDAWKALGERGALLVLEHDDDYINFRTDHPTFKTGLSWADYEAFGRDIVIETLQAADLITVSVPHLAQVYREYTDKPIVVLPNTIDEVLFQVPQRVRRPDEEFVVGWGGTPSHQRDWELCGPGVKWGLTRSNAKMIMMGADFRPLLGYRNTEWRDWTNHIDEYYLAIHGYHVLLAPLTDELWSRSKSPLKALEAAALGVPSVVGDATPYRDFVVHGETGFLCRTQDDWMQAIRALGNDEAMRQEMGLAARERAREFITADWARTWADTYADALAAKRQAATAASETTVGATR